MKLWKELPRNPGFSENSEQGEQWDTCALQTHACMDMWEMFKFQMMKPNESWIVDEEEKEQRKW